MFLRIWSDGLKNCGKMTVWNLILQKKYSEIIYDFLNVKLWNSFKVNQWGNLENIWVIIVDFDFRVLECKKFNESFNSIILKQRSLTNYSFDQIFFLTKPYLPSEILWISKVQQFFFTFLLCSFHKYKVQQTNLILIIKVHGTTRRKFSTIRSNSKSKFN